MTEQQFFTECYARDIHPALALEQPEVIAALESRDDKAVIAALENAL